MHIFFLDNLFGQACPNYPISSLNFPDGSCSESTQQQRLDLILLLYLCFCDLYYLINNMKRWQNHKIQRYRNTICCSMLVVNQSDQRKCLGTREHSILRFQVSSRSKKHASTSTKVRTRQEIFTVKQYSRIPALQASNRKLRQMSTHCTCTIAVQFRLKCRHTLQDHFCDCLTTYQNFVLISLNQMALMDEKPCFSALFCMDG